MSRAAPGRGPDMDISHKEGKLNGWLAAEEWLDDHPWEGPRVLVLGESELGFALR